MTSADEIKQRLDSLEASLLSAHHRTSDAYSETVAKTTRQGTTTPAPPAQWSNTAGVNMAGTTASETCSQVTASNRGISPTTSRQDFVACRQVGTGTGEVSVCSLNECQQRTLTGNRHIGSDIEEEQRDSERSFQEKASIAYRQVATNTGNSADLWKSHTFNTYRQVGYYTGDEPTYGRTDPREKETYRCAATDTDQEPTQTPKRTSVTQAATRPGRDVKSRKTVAQQTNFIPYRPVAAGDDGDSTVGLRGPREKIVSVCSPVAARTSRDLAVKTTNPATAAVAAQELNEELRQVSRLT